MLQLGASASVTSSLSFSGEEKEGQSTLEGYGLLLLV